MWPCPPPPPSLAQAPATVLPTGHFSGDPAADRAFTLKLDAHGRLAELSYLGPAPAEARNLGRLVGLHSALLGGAPATHARGEVDDWLALSGRTGSR